MLIMLNNIKKVNCVVNEEKYANVYRTTSIKNLIWRPSMVDTWRLKGYCQLIRNAVKVYQIFLLFLQVVQY